MLRVRSLFLENVKSSIGRLPREGRLSVRDGAIMLGGLTGAFAYINYRLYIKKTFLRSEGHYRFGQEVKNCTPWKQMYFTWWRMPIEEWSISHRFKPYYLIGQLDLSKEVLIPRDKVINGQLVKGFEVVNPLYCYEGGTLSFKNALENKGDGAVGLDRSAIIVVRGWVPAEYRDKRSRPAEAAQQKQLVKVCGTWMRGKDIHDYKIPNNPDNNDWHNLALEDIGLFWDLPNFDEAKWYYFRAVNLGSNQNGVISDVATPVQADSKDEVIEGHYKWRVHDTVNKGLMYTFGAFSTACWLTGAAAVAML